MFGNAFGTSEGEAPVRVLVGIGDHGFRRIISSVIRAEGPEVVETCNETDLLFELLRSRQPSTGELDLRWPVSAIVADMRREGARALDTLAKIRVIHPDVSVIMLVGRVSEAFEMQARSHGAHLLALPMSSQNLRSALAVALSGPAVVSHDAECAVACP